LFVLTSCSKICIIEVKKMKKGIKDMVAALSTIDKIIETPTKKPTKEEATKILRSCGILDNKNNIKSAYKKIITEENYEQND